MNRVWTEEELDILRHDRAARIPVPVTAAKLGRPVPATYARARLIGTLVQPHQSWDEASITRLRELVSADPPLTDKRIAAELGRTVTQIRWKMQDLGLIGVRDLSKLAKITAASSARAKTATSRQQARAPYKPAAGKSTLPEHGAKTPSPATAPKDPALEIRAGIDAAVKALEARLADQLNGLIRASEAGMIQAAKDAIAEKVQIDGRLAAFQRPGHAELNLESSQEASTESEAKAGHTISAPVAIGHAGLKRGGSNRKPAQPVLPTARGLSRPAPSTAPLAEKAANRAKIIVADAPSTHPPLQEITPAQVSGRGGWKSVRRDPARVAAQVKATSVTRADAVDLAQAAQAAIARFMAERGVTRSEAGGIQALTSRLQARGYIVVRDGDGWLIDQRHRIENEAALTAFAEARGIRLDIAA